MNAWHGDTVVILASGPSLTVEQCERVRAWHASGQGRAIAINTTHRRAPWADVLYGCDGQWWRYAIGEVRRTFRGQCWTQDEAAARAHGLSRVRSVRGEGLSRVPGVIHQGGGLTRAGNSGYQAINLAWQWGAAAFVLLGFDMQAAGRQRHWHVPHVVEVASPYEHWRASFPALARDLADEGVAVINATPGSALDCFPLVDLEEALHARAVPAA